jgi:hypothetical protein
MRAPEARGSPNVTQYFLLSLRRVTRVSIIAVLETGRVPRVPQLFARLQDVYLLRRQSTATMSRRWRGGSTRQRSTKFLRLVQAQ